MIGGKVAFALFAMLGQIQAEDVPPPKLKLRIQNGGAIQFGRGGLNINPQPAADADADDNEGEIDPQRVFPTERNTSQLLSKARRQLDAGAHDQAITALQFILDQDNDYFVEPGSEGTALPAGAKSQAARLIAGLPREARQSYELRYGLTARQMLDEAIRNRDLALLQTVMRRFFHTEAGYEATYQLASYSLDRSESLAAAAEFERLRRIPEARRKWDPMLSLKTAIAWSRAGLEQRSLQTLLELRDSAGGKPIKLGDKEVSLFEQPEAALDWLHATLGRPEHSAMLAAESWWMFGGDPARNATAAPAAPLGPPKWTRKSTTAPFSSSIDVDDPVNETTQAELPEAEAAEENDTVFDSDTGGFHDDDSEPSTGVDLQRALERLAIAHGDDSFLSLPAAHPIVVGNLVIYRTFSNIRAIDLTSGKLVWETSCIDMAYEEYFASPDPDSLLRGRVKWLNRFLEHRTWRDTTSGTLSSDGKRVFAVLNSAVIAPHSAKARGTEANTLMAFDAASGKLLWEVGGWRGDRSLSLAGSYFLGPPLPLDGIAYCIVESGGEISLAAIDAGTGQVEWAQPLVLAELNMTRYPVRRLSGISPSYADGILVCPTTSGAVVAVDLARRVLLWGFQYPTNIPHRFVNQRAAMAGRASGDYQIVRLDDEGRWIDSNSVIADGRVLLTPRDSDQLHCINLLDGTVEWMTPRNQYLFVAGVQDGRVVLVGRSEVRAIDLRDGQSVWDDSLSIPMPAGRGVQTEHLYHLPLSTGEFCTIDMRSGRMTARPHTPDGTVLGNLVAADGSIVSQSIGHVQGLQSLDELKTQIAETLEQSPDDADALARRGQLLLHRGDEQAGLEVLRKAIANGAAEDAVEAVVHTLLEGLRLHFEEYRSTADEIRELPRSDEQYARFLRLWAQGLHEAGERQAAFSAYLDLARVVSPDEQAVPVSGSLRSRNDRWVRPRIAELYLDATDEERRSMDRAIRDELNKAVAADSTEALRRFTNCFFHHAIADEARRDLLERLEPAEAALEIEFLCEQLRESNDRQLAGYATARLASLWIALERTSGIQPLLNELSEKYDNIECLDDLTGTQLVEKWRADESTAALLESPKPWPEEHLVGERVSHQMRSRRGLRIPPSRIGLAAQSRSMRVVPDGRSYFDNWQVTLDQSDHHLDARDARGNETWQFATAQLKRRVPTLSEYRVHVRGHLAATMFGNHFAVLNTLTASDDSELLWKGELQEVAPGQKLDEGVQERHKAGPTGKPTVSLVDSLGRPIGAVGPMTADYFCYQKGPRIVAADPLSGDVLWERREIPRGSTMVGDADFVLVIPPDSSVAMILRADDGEYLGEKPLPTEGDRLKIDGRRVLSWETAGEKRRLSSIDIPTGTALWTREFASDAQIALVGRDEVAVLEPQGRFVVLDLDDGELRIEGQVDPTTGLEEIVVLRTSGRYVLLSRSKQHNEQNVRADGVAFRDPLVNGYAYGLDDRTGALAWKTPIEQQAVDLDQPNHVPFVHLTVRKIQFFPRGNVRSANQSYTVMVLDARNGRIVYSKSGPERLINSQLEIDAEQDRFVLHFLQSAIELKFSGVPLSDPPPGDAEKSAPDVPADDANQPATIPAHPPDE